MQNIADQLENLAIAASDTCLSAAQTKQDHPHGNAGFFVTHNEIFALKGMSELAFRLYMRIRQRMDMATQISGKVVHHSLEALAEFAQTEIRRGQGWEIRRPSRKQILTALENLVGQGLIQNLGNLVFFLPKAHRPAQTRHGHGTKQLPKIANKSKANKEKQTQSTAKPGTHQEVQEIKAKHGARLNTSNPIQLPNEITTPTTHPAAAALLNWFKEFTALTGRKVSYRPDDPLLLTFAKLNQSQLQHALHAAHKARTRDNSPAPINLPFLSRFLVLNKSPNPTKPSRLPLISPPKIDPIAEAKGRELLAKIAQKRMGNAKPTPSPLNHSSPMANSV